MRVGPTAISGQQVLAARAPGGQLLRVLTGKVSNKIGGCKRNHPDPTPFECPQEQPYHGPKDGSLPCP